MLPELLLLYSTLYTCFSLRRPKGLLPLALLGSKLFLRLSLPVFIFSSLPLPILLFLLLALLGLLGSKPFLRLSLPVVIFSSLPLPILLFSLLALLGLLLSLPGLVGFPLLCLTSLLLLLPTFFLLPPDAIFLVPLRFCFTLASVPFWRHNLASITPVVFSVFF